MILLLIVLSAPFLVTVSADPKMDSENLLLLKKNEDFLLMLKTRTCLFSIIHSNEYPAWVRMDEIVTQIGFSVPYSPLVTATLIDKSNVTKSSELRNRRNSQEFRKFSQCCVALYANWVRYASQAIRKSLHVMKYEQSQVLMSEISKKFNRIDFMIKVHKLKKSISVLWLEPDGTKVVHPECKDELLNAGQFNVFRYDNSVWKCSRLQYEYIMNIKGSLKDNKREVCNIGPDCVIRLLIQEFNISVTFAKIKAKRSRKVAIFSIKYAYLTNGNMGTFQEKPIIEAHTVDFDSFGILLLSNSWKLNDLSALAMPFKSYVWFGLGLAALVHIILSKIFKNPVWPFLAAILEQSAPKIVRGVSTSSKAPSILTCVWLFGTLILNNAYKGKLYSKITTTSPPKAPESIEDTLAEDIQVVTCTKITGIWNEKNETKMLKETLLNDLIKKLKPVSGTELSVLLSKLNSTVKPLVDDMKAIFEIYENKTKRDKSWENLIFFDTTTKIKKISSAFKIFTNHCIDISSHENFLFRKHFAWMFHRHLASKFLKNLLSKLSSSGIYRLWQQRAFENACYQELQKIFTNETNNKGMKIKPKVDVKPQRISTFMKFRNFQYISHTPLSSSRLWVPLRLYLELSAACIYVLIIEILFTKLVKYCKRLERVLRNRKKQNASPLPQTLNA